MSTALIDDLLKRGIRHPLQGHVVEFPTHKIMIEAGAIEKIGQMVARYFPPLNNVAVISDANTHPVAAERVEQILHKYYQVTSIILPQHVRPSVREVRHIHSMVGDAGLLIAVGSGTVNDLVKFSSHTAGKPYAVVATAPSMNGYASANASIEEEDGFKHTLPAHMPKMIWMDTAVMAQAPRRLISSGIGDSLCRTTAQADWLLSYFLLGTDYISTPFKWLKDNEKRLIPSVDRAVHKSKEAIEILCENLILSGLGMVLCGGSYPASQAEHMIAHTMEMRHGKTLQHSFHGEQIAVTTLTLARLQEKLLEQQLEVKHRPTPDAWFDKQFGTTLGPQCRAEYRKKEITPEKAHSMNQRIDKFWPEMVSQLKKVMVPSETIRAALLAAGSPTTPDEIGWPKDAYRKACMDALFTRNRFTFLDYAFLTGKLEEIL
jgi:glycerol-1-phosphate dehydrogenase [NAD(P)+]